MFMCLKAALPCDITGEMTNKHMNNIWPQDRGGGGSGAHVASSVPSVILN